VIFKLMTTDGLTGAYNKRYLLETIERELRQSARAGEPLCVAMLDLDKFKLVNDAYGHLAGDAVLVEFARRAKSVLRSGDLLARYGGEEFSLLLTRTDLEEAVQVAERVRLITSAEPVAYEDQLISVTVSIGLSSTYCRPDRTPLELISIADDRLYHAKESGRNQVCCEAANSVYQTA
jgi:diguanylate cyclase (GGDEF)-like protein